MFLGREYHFGGSEKWPPQVLSMADLPRLPLESLRMSLFWQSKHQAMDTRARGPGIALIHHLFIRSIKKSRRALRLRVRYKGALKINTCIIFYILFVFYLFDRDLFRLVLPPHPLPPLRSLRRRPEERPVCEVSSFSEGRRRARQ